MAPTGTGQVLASGTVALDARGAGSTTIALDLSGFSPQGTKGYHVRATIGAANDGAGKHKTFWVVGCDDIVAPPDRVVRFARPAAAKTRIATGEKTKSPARPGPEAPASLPFTGSDPALLLLVAGVLIAVGSAAGAPRRYKGRHRITR